MVKLIMGLKGMGKTKQLIEMVNEAAKTEDGYVVCIEKGTKLTYDIVHSVRLIDVDQFDVTDFDTFYGFLCGIIAGNYDISKIFIDSILKITGVDIDKFAKFLEKLEALAKKEDKVVIITASYDPSLVDDRIKKYFK